MNVVLLAQDEILKYFSTRRGLLALLGFLLIWVAVLYFGILPVADFASGARESGLGGALLQQLGLQAWQDWPAPALAVYWICSLYLLPFFAVIASADQTSSDRHRGTLRYLSLRCSRLSIFFGRFFGQCAVMLLVVLLTLGSVVLIVAFKEPAALQSTLTKGPLIVLNLMLLLLPYVALMAMVSVLAKSARQATLIAVVLWILVSLLVALIQARFVGLQWLDWLLPGSQVRQLLVLTDWGMLNLAPIPLLHTLFLLTVGASLMWWRDL